MKEITEKHIPVKRASGYYWVMLYSEWRISYYDSLSNTWDLSGTLREFVDTDFSQIEPTPLTHIYPLI